MITAANPNSEAYGFKVRVGAICVVAKLWQHQKPHLSPLRALGQCGTEAHRPSAGWASERWSVHFMPATPPNAFFSLKRCKSPARGGGRAMGRRPFGPLYRPGRRWHPRDLGGPLRPKDAFSSSPTIGLATPAGTYGHADQARTRSDFGSYIGLSDASAATLLPATSIS